MHVLLTTLHFHILFTRIICVSTAVSLLFIGAPLFVSAQVADTPAAPTILSDTFTDTQSWYRVTNGVVSWVVPDDVIRIAAEVVDNVDAEPQIPYEPSVTELLLTEAEVSDGKQYFALQFRNENGWGEVSYIPIFIDREAPETFSIDVRNGVDAFPEIVFTAEDSDSGIMQIEFLVHGEREVIIVAPEEARAGVVFEGRKDGLYAVTATAFDYAGNAVSSTFEVSVEAGWKQSSEHAAAGTTWHWVPEYLIFDIDSLIDAQLFTTIVLTCMIFALLIMLREERIRYNKREDLFELELESVHGQITHIFSTLRADVFQHLSSVDSKTKRKTTTKKKSATKKTAE